MKSNLYIREYARINNVFLWEIADAMEISVPTMTRLMRHVIDQDRTERIISIINKIAENKGHKPYTINEVPEYV